MEDVLEAALLESVDMLNNSNINRKDYSLAEMRLLRGARSVSGGAGSSRR